MILVSGPTGNVGSTLLPRLAEAGAPVRGLAHSPDSRRRIEARGFEAVDGDFDDPASLERAMQGCDHLLLLTPPDPAQVEREKAAVDAARRSGVNHVVAVSVIGADPSSPGAFARWHGHIDAHLMASGLAYTILRPAGLMQVHLWPVGMVRGAGAWYGMTGDGPSAFVDADDVAAVAAEVLTRPGHTGAVYELTGPEAITMPQAAGQLSAVVGRDIAYVDVPAEDFGVILSGAGLPEWLVEAAVTLYRTIREGHMATVTDQVERVTGRPARSFRQFAEARRDDFAAL